MKFIHADLLEWDAPTDAFDLVVTNFFLDCFPAGPLALVISKLGKCATPDAHWLLANFEIAFTPLAGLVGRVIIGMFYTFFRTVTGLKAFTIVPPEDVLGKAGFSFHRRETHDWRLLKSEWWWRN